MVGNNGVSGQVSGRRFFSLAGADGVGRIEQTRDAADADATDAAACEIGTVSYEGVQI
jgi:hypothetical protein